MRRRRGSSLCTKWAQKLVAVVYKTYTKNNGFVYEMDTTLCTKRTCINTQVRHISWWMFFGSRFFKRCVVIRDKDTLILCFAHKNTHPARDRYHGRLTGFFMVYINTSRHCKTMAINSLEVV